MICPYHSIPLEITYRLIRKTLRVDDKGRAKDFSCTIICLIIPAKAAWICIILYKILCGELQKIYWTLIIYYILINSDIYKQYILYDIICYIILLTLKNRLTGAGISKKSYMIWFRLQLNKFSWLLTPSLQGDFIFTISLRAAVCSSTGCHSDFIGWQNITCYLLL